MKLFRVENRDSNLGLWYQARSAWPTNLVHTLDLSGKNLPMDFDPNLFHGGWRSAADSLDTLRFWFTKEDLQKLKPLGWKLYEIDAEATAIHSTPYYTHHLFQLTPHVVYLERDIEILEQ